MENIKYLIPARKGSKGLPGKNRLLFDETAKLLKGKDVIVSTDDEILIEKSKEYNFNVHVRSEKNASDLATTKDFVLEIIKDLKFDKDDIIVMLYLTYPGRTLKDIENAINFFESNNANSLLCREKTSDSPYIMLFEKPDNKGEQVIKHNFSRRQDYLEVFKLCFFVCIFKVKEVVNLNNNMYNNDTIYYKLNDNIFDIDTIDDLERYYKSKKGEENV